MQNRLFFISYFLIFFFLANSSYAIENILLFGPPGSGKGTLSQIAIQKGPFMHICPGDMIRKEIFEQTPFGLEVKERVALGEDLPQEIVFEMIKLKLEECLTEHKYFIIDGFPRSVSGYLLLKDFFFNHKIDKKEVIVVILDFPDETLKERLKHRNICLNCFHIYNNISFPPKEVGVCDFCHHLLQKRLNDTDEVISKRLKDYHERIFPIASLVSQEFCTIYLTSLEEINQFLAERIQN